jgi:hypothetical protein
MSATCLVDVSRYVDTRAQFGKTFEESFAPYHIIILDTVKDTICRTMGKAVDICL